MNWRLALSELEAERSHLRLDGEPVILYSLLSPPGQAHANLLRELYCLDAAMTVSLEWRPWAMEAARRRIRGAQRHYFARRYSMMAHVQETEGTAAAMVDSAAATESDRLGEALVELEADGVSYGEASVTRPIGDMSRCMCWRIHSGTKKGTVSSVSGCQREAIGTRFRSEPVGLIATRMAAAIILAEEIRQRAVGADHIAYDAVTSEDGKGLEGRVVGPPNR